MCRQNLEVRAEAYDVVWTWRITCYTFFVCTRMNFASSLNLFGFDLLLSTLLFNQLQFLVPRLLFPTWASV